jgi:hypothetical protein
MSGLRCIVYISKATRLLSDIELETLLIDARDFNKKNGVTGVLICHKDLFMQCIEGSKDSLNKAYKRITDSSQHKDIIKVFDSSINELSFPNWVMGLSRPVKSELLKLNTANWTESMKGKNDSMGMVMLKKFWANCAKFGY